ncbi:MAG: cytochrome c3 family protein [Sandaracinaceae bacterium]
MSPWMAAFLGGSLWICAVTGWYVAREKPWWVRLLAALGLAGLLAGFASVLRPAPVDAELLVPLPGREREGGYVSSDTCGACHPGQHASWHRSFHRTMTQVATPEAVRAPFDGRVLEERGRQFQLGQRDDTFYVAEVTPRVGEGEASGFWGRAHRVVMTTGSHHMQAYWIEGRDGKLEQVPFVYLIEQDRWLANSDSFLEPAHADDDPLERYTWSDSCITCHSTGGPFDASALSRDATPENSVTELGIACEACHGPGQAHVEANRDPLRRYLSHAKETGDPTIVNPARLPHDRSAAVCGRCHSVHPDGEGERVHGFRPGDRLDAFLSIDAMFEMTDHAAASSDVEWLAGDDRDTVGSFWLDGSCRVAGREHTQMIRSGCYLRGEMDCTSCHSMHDADPDRQVSLEDHDDDAMCLGCHTEMAANLDAHTHHAADGPGARCVNCHMPYTAYALLMGTRSHRMDGPSATGRLGRDRPNACNLCHQSETFAWTAGYLSAWYGAAEPSLEVRHDEVPAGVHWLLRGDATQRALAAWHLGRPATRAVTDVDAMRPALESLLEDPYAAVRQIAVSTLATIDPSLELDIVAITREPQHQDTGVPEFEALRVARDDTPVAIPE